MPLLNDAMSTLATGRATEMFAEDMRQHRTEIAEQLRGKHVLVIGGAGSIGAATIHALAEFEPEALHVVDTNENCLAELLRDLRSRERGLAVPDFRVLPLDFGSPIMQRFLRDQSPYHIVFNFAAVKHVRSEKDVPSVLHMLETNVLKQARLLEWLGDQGTAYKYFSVSTDKAANPVNLMGASKRLMEHVIFSGAVASSATASVTSARFANVAFSNGSLLQSFLFRLEKRQPLAVPGATRRFFVSLSEAAQTCLLAALCAPDKHIVVPRLHPEKDMHELDSIAMAVLRHQGLVPRIYEDEEEARRNIDADMTVGKYPLLVTPLDTAGEKPFEEFVSDVEETVELGMIQLLGIRYHPAKEDAIRRLLDELRQLVGSPETLVTKRQIIDAVTVVVPEFQHTETGKNLDDRM